MDALRTLLNLTARTMETPAPYGAFHLLFFFVGTGAAVLGARLCANLGVRASRRLLLSVGAVFLLAEVYKQLFYCFIINNGAYDYWIFPFQLCSIPMYLCIIAPLLRPGRVKNTLYDFLLGYGTMAGFAAFLQPEGMLHGYVALTLHSCLWHVVQMFVGLFLGFSGRAGTCIRSFLRSMLLYALLCGVAYCINIALFPLAGGQINMFYIGPMQTTTIVFRDIASACGQLAASLAYMAASSLGAFLVFLPFYLRRRRKLPNVAS